MTQNNSAGAAVFKNPLDGLRKPQVRQFGRTMLRVAELTSTLEKSNKALNEARFTIKAGLSRQESNKAIQAAKAAEKAHDKAQADLGKIADKLVDDEPLKAALAAYQALEEAAPGNPAARNLLDQVNADLAIAAAPSPTRSAKSVAREAPVGERQNGIGTDEPPTLTLTEFVESRGLPFASLEDALSARVGYDEAEARGEIVRTSAKDAKKREADDKAAAKTRGQADDHKRREPNEFLDRARPTFPPSLLARYAVRGNEVVDKRTDAVAFVDSGKELRATGDVGRDVIEAMLETAETRGWAPVKVFGTEAFKAAVWMEAASRGMEVTGYKPSAQELEVAAQNRKVNGRENSIAAGGAVGKQEPAAPSREEVLAKTFLEAGSARQQSRAAKQFPELANAFTLMACFEKSIAKPGLPQNQSRDFSDQFKDLLAERLREGKALPTATLADRSQEKQQAEADRER